MIQLPIPSRNRVRVKHPGGEPPPLGTSPAVALVYLAGGIAIVLTLHESALPPDGALWALGFFAAFQFFLMFFSVPVTAFGSSTKGYLSFDRLPLVAAVLLFGPVPAAWAAGGAALAFSLASNIYREPWRQLIARAAGNGGMFLLSTLAAGLVYTSLGGGAPLTQLDLVDFGRVCALILTLQVVNEALYFAMIWPGMSRESRRSPVHWPSTLTELIIAFTGLVTALVYVKLPLTAFALYVALIVNVAVLLKIMVKTAGDERQRARELAAVNRVNQAVDSAANLDELIEIIFREARGLMKFAAFLIALYEPEADEIDVRFNYDEGVRHPQMRRKPGEGLLAWTIKQQQSVLIADARTDTHPSIQRRLVTGKPAISIMAVPINFQGVTVGVVSVQDYRPRVFRPYHLQLLEGFAKQIAVAIVNTRLFAELQAYQKKLEVRVAHRTAELERTSSSLARAVDQKEVLLRRLERENRRDPLTGLANRRHLDETLRQEHYRARRFRHPLAVAISDLDNFKQINDHWGHALGDEVLKTIAGILRTELRATDLTARYGGEEFVILFPETNLDAALGVCEKLRGLIESHPWARLAPGLEVTMSFGIVGIEDERETEAQLLSCADRALYRAKRDGRNRVCAAESR